MGKLIDGTIQALPLSNYILERKDTFIRVLEKGDNDFLFGMLINYFDEQPTAFDLNRVEEQLEEFRPELEQHGCGGILTDMIEVVERGGIK